MKRLPRAVLALGLGLGLSLERGAPIARAETPPVRIWLIRHGQALSNLEKPPAGLSEAQLDHLTDAGRAQSKQAAAELKARRPALILSSPANRARETAELLSKELGAVEVRVEPRLRPLDLGRRADGTPFDWDQRIARWENGQDPRPEGGESIEDVARRVEAVAMELAATHAGQDVVLVAHSDVIAPFSSRIEGLAPASWYPPRVPNGSLTEVEARTGESCRLLRKARLPRTIED